MGNEKISWRLRKRHTIEFITKEATLEQLLVSNMECGGLVIYHMKLESGSFNLPVFDQNTHTFQTSWQDLMMMVQGASSDEKTKKKQGKTFKIVG